MQSLRPKKHRTNQKGIRCVLGIETSCDETGVAVYDVDQGLLAHSLHSQASLHNRHGGVVPELASRDHILRILPLLQKTLQAAQRPISTIDGIAYCSGPGLSGALLVGAAFARSLGWTLAVPTLGVHHMEAHLLAVMLEQQVPAFPFLALLVSGGHTLLVQVEALGRYQVLGESVDDAVGEAFDKVAKLLGLDYPGGPALAQLAERGRPGRFRFPRPMLDKPTLNFSFSGLKTFVSCTLKTVDHDEQTKADIAHAFQMAVVDTLVKKTQRAMIRTGLKRVVVAGGVAANRALRAQLGSAVQNMQGESYCPRQEFCTDNGAMIAYLGSQRLRQGQQDDLSIKMITRLRLDQLESPHLNSDSLCDIGSTT